MLPILLLQESRRAFGGEIALLFDPDPKSSSGQSARLIGYSPTAAAVLVVILVRREARPGSWWGANGWRAISTDRRTYAEGKPPS